MSNSNERQPDQDLDPQDAILDPHAEDPNPEPITDKSSADYVEPAKGIKPRKRG